MQLKFIHGKLANPAARKSRNLLKSSTVLLGALKYLRSFLQPLSTYGPSGGPYVWIPMGHGDVEPVVTWNQVPAFDPRSPPLRAPERSEGVLKTLHKSRVVNDFLGFRV